MQYSEINWNTICYSAFKYKNTDELKVFLESEELSDICNNLSENTIVVLGWDGTMLRAINENYSKGLPFLWINFWNKWFLLNDKKYITKKSVYKNEIFPIMECVIKSWGKVYNDIFINEVNISAGWWKMLELKVILWNRKHFNVKWDGILISTPIWSTWYNASLWGPIMSHNTHNLSITPKAIWSPKWQQAIIINDNEIIELNNYWRCHSVEIYTDGRELIKTIHEANIIIKTAV